MYYVNLDCFYFDKNNLMNFKFKYCKNNFLNILFFFYFLENKKFDEKFILISI